MDVDGATDTPGDGSDDAQFHVLRAHVEREVRAPAVVMVTSAETGDGKSLTAYSLVHCLARAGRRAALVAGNDAALATEPFPVVRLARPAVALGREAADDFLRSARSAYDFTIVDAGPLLSDEFALGLVGGVDGVLVSVRVGRAPTGQDELMVRLIERSNGRIVGVVAAHPAAIRLFAQRFTEDGARDRSDRRVPASGGVAARPPFAASIRS